MSGKILQLFLVLGGLGTLAFSTVSLARRRMNGTLSLVWGLFSLLMILAGCLIHPVNLHLYLSGRGLALALLGSLCLLAAAYFISVELTELMRRTRETAIQASLPRPEGRPREKELLVVIPAYNEEGNIGKLIRGLREADVESYADILVVDDGSEDGTRREAEVLSCLCVRGIYNQGYGTALQMGYRYALGEGYSYVVQMDADGQHDVGAVAELYRALREPDESGRRPDIVLGSRFLPGGGTYPLPWARMLGIRLFRRLILWATGRRITDPTTGLQGLSRRAVQAYARYDFFDGACPDANVIMQMLLSGYHIREIPAVMYARASGKSMHDGLEPVEYVLRMAVSLPAVYIRGKLLRKG